MAIQRKQHEAPPVRITAPILTGEITPNDDLKALLEREETVENQHFSRGMTDWIDRPYLTIRNCVVSQQLFVECQMKSAQISDVRFENCDLSNIVFTGSALHRVAFVACKLVGTNFTETTMNHVLMKECMGQYINLSMSKMTQVRFDGCDFRNGYFNECRASEMEFDNCQLVEADLTRTSLKGIDLRSSRIEGIQVGIQDIRGAIVSSVQVIDLLPLLGVVVKD